MVSPKTLGWVSCPDGCRAEKDKTKDLEFLENIRKSSWQILKEFCILLNGRADVAEDQAQNLSISITEFSFREYGSLPGVSC